MKTRIVKKQAKLQLKSLHHIAIICSDYKKSKEFYTNILGFTILKETFRNGRNSYKLDLILDSLQIELFSFPNPPKRRSFPEAVGLRHIAFLVEDVEEVAKQISLLRIEVEPVRIDPTTGKKFTFFLDPDSLPIEIYEE